MGASRLSPRSVRRIAQTTGLDVVFAWSHHTYWHNFCTRDHRHGWWNCRSHEWVWDDGVLGSMHYPDCDEWFVHVGHPAAAMAMQQPATYSVLCRPSGRT